MLSRDKMRFKGTGTCQGPQGRDSSLTTFTFSVFRVRDNLLWDEKHGKEKKRKKTGWREEMVGCLCLIILWKRIYVWEKKNMTKEGKATFEERIWSIVRRGNFLNSIEDVPTRACPTRTVQATWFDSI